MPLHFIDKRWKDLPKVKRLFQVSTVNSHWNRNYWILTLHMLLSLNKWDFVLELCLNWDLKTICFFFEVTSQMLRDLKLLRIISKQQVAKSLVASCGSWERFYFYFFLVVCIFALWCFPPCFSWKCYIWVLFIHCEWICQFLLCLFEKSP